MTLEKLEPEDLAVCVNYVTEQYAKYSGNNHNKGLAERVEYAMEGKEGWKVMEDGVMLGYTVVEDFGSNILITSLVIGEPYRTGKATWLLFKKILEISKGRNGVYKPIHENMWASKVCVKGKIDKERAKQWVSSLTEKWG